jgi:hypothetical protein
MRPSDASIELQPVLSTVCQLYSSKIAADLQADSAHTRRQTLPEFMYSTFLFQAGEPSAGRHALTEFVSLVFYFEKVSAVCYHFIYFIYFFALYIVCCLRFMFLQHAQSFL